MIEKVKQALENIVERSGSENISQAIALSTLPIPNVPAAMWPLLNQSGDSR